MPGPQENGAVLARRTPGRSPGPGSVRVSSGAVHPSPHGPGGFPRISMPERMLRRVLSLAIALAPLSPAPASAKVAFTGYGHVVMPAYSEFRIRGSSPALGSRPEGNLISKGFRLDAAGLFASTKIGEDSEFLMDLTFRNVGATVGQTRIQYAYLESGLPWQELRLQLGRVNIPFNYYNNRRFYPFQRVELSAPIFINGIMGLPIADTGLVLARRFELGPEWTLDARAYGVNGYGHLAGSSTTLRNPTLPGGLVMSGNLGAANNNKDIAWGGQLALGRSEDGEAGASYYRGAWDPQGRRVLQLAGAHAYWTPGSFDILVEYHHIHAQGDEGMVGTLGSADWSTHGAFLTVGHPLFRVGERTVDAWGHAENYASAGRGGGPHEVLRSYSGGLRSMVDENITLKSEYMHLFYRVPTAPASVIVDGYVVQGAVVITF
jgi:hypothetical protein